MVETKKKRSLEELKILSEPLFSHKEANKLINIAKVMSSPSSVADAVKRVTEDEEIIKACRWLAIAKRDYGVIEFERVIAANSK